MCRFPWIDLTKDSNRQRMKLFSNKETKEMLNPALKKVIYDLNDCDMKLHNKMEEIFSEQMKIVYSKEIFL